MPQTSDKAPYSPCIRNCCLDDQDICLGCNRSLSEILAWHQSTERQKRDILLLCRRREAERRRASNKLLRRH